MVFNLTDPEYKYLATYTVTGVIECRNTSGNTIVTVPKLTAEQQAVLNNYHEERKVLQTVTYGEEYGATPEAAVNSLIDHMKSNLKNPVVSNIRPSS